MTWATDVLGLPADADARAIKRAYAARLKTARPDDDPVAFQQLHETYQAALAHAACTQRADENAAPDNGPLPSAPTPKALSDSNHPMARARPSLAAYIEDPTLAAEIERWQDAAHVQDCAARILAAAQDIPGDSFSAWLSALPEWWSLELRPEIGQALAALLEHQRLPITDAAFDLLITSFGDDPEAEASHMLWAARLLDVALERSPESFELWMQSSLEAWSPYQNFMISLHVSRALGTQRPSLRLATIDTLMKTFGWHASEKDDNVAWLHTARRTARKQELDLRRQSALALDGDAAVLAYELKVAGWTAMTPQWAAALRSRLTRSPSPWRSMATALLPVRPTWMYRFCGIVQRWFPHQLPESIYTENVRFWTQIGNPYRPHARQLVLGLTRGLAVAALLAVGASLLAVLSAIHSDTENATWAFDAIGRGLAGWSMLVLVHLGAHWQARTVILSARKRVAHRWLLPAAMTACIACSAGGLNAVMGAAMGAAFIYMAMYRVMARMTPPSAVKAAPSLIISGAIGLAAAASGASLWPGVAVALVLWLVSLVQDAQHDDLSILK
ncbi:J domain-containing protein [Xanthomonas oryzae]|uniref:J domain-containing protein n=2 Tax=Xanthomonas oryzae TaxID=347 RepID=UPI0010342009|nr:J domain-containing protein [Xanthomonas oryzae]QBG98268.1 J domain-containing protein [Xanthomonas oryzae]